MDSSVMNMSVANVMVHLGCTLKEKVHRCSKLSEMENTNHSIPPMFIGCGPPVSDPNFFLHMKKGLRSTVFDLAERQQLCPEDNAALTLYTTYYVREDEIGHNSTPLQVNWSPEWSPYNPHAVIPLENDVREDPVHWKHLQDAMLERIATLIGKKCDYDFPLVYRTVQCTHYSPAYENYLKKNYLAENQEQNPEPGAEEEDGDEENLEPENLEPGAEEEDGDEENLEPENPEPGAEEEDGNLEPENPEPGAEEDDGAGGLQNAGEPAVLAATLSYKRTLVQNFNSAVAGVHDEIGYTQVQRRMSMQEFAREAWLFSAVLAEKYKFALYCHGCQKTVEDVLCQVVDSRPLHKTCTCPIGNGNFSFTKAPPCLAVWEDAQKMNFPETTCKLGSVDWELVGGFFTDGRKGHTSFYMHNCNLQKHTHRVIIGYVKRGRAH